MDHQPIQIARRPDYLEQLLSEKQAAKLLGISDRTLRNWRVRGGGPKFVRVSARCIRYKRGDLQDWIDRKVASNTSQYPAKQV